jgi:hypothetical protein
MPPVRSPENSRANRWGVINTVSTIKCWRIDVLRVVLAFGRWFGGYSRSLGHVNLVEQRVIALARWTLLPRNERPRHLMFETNWSGNDASYIPDFATVMPNQWKAIWGNTKGFPGPVPTTKLLEYVREVDWGADHFWSDYRPDASTQTVLAALDLRKQLVELIDRTRSFPPDRFATPWREFMTRAQHDL